MVMEFDVSGILTWVLYERMLKYTCEKSIDMNSSLDLNFQKENLCS